MKNKKIDFDSLIISSLGLSGLGILLVIAPRNGWAMLAVGLIMLSACMRLAKQKQELENELTKVDDDDDDEEDPSEAWKQN